MDTENVGYMILVPFMAFCGTLLIGMALSFYSVQSYEVWLYFACVFAVLAFLLTVPWRDVKRALKKL